MTKIQNMTKIQRDSEVKTCVLYRLHSLLYNPIHSIKTNNIYPYIPLLSYPSIIPYPTLLHNSNPLRYSTIPTQPKDLSAQ